MANGKRKSKTWPTKAHVRGGKGWVPHPNKPGYEINVMDMSIRKAGSGKKKR